MKSLHIRIKVKDIPELKTVVDSLKEMEKDLENATLEIEVAAENE